MESYGGYIGLGLPFLEVPIMRMVVYIYIYMYVSVYMYSVVYTGIPLCMETTI